MSFAGRISKQTIVKCQVPGSQADHKKVWSREHVDYRYGCFLNGGTQQPWVFLLKMIILGCEMGVPPFKETPI